MRKFLLLLSAATIAAPAVAADPDDGGRGFGRWVREAREQQQHPQAPADRPAAAAAERPMRVERQQRVRSPDMGTLERRERRIERSGEIGEMPRIEQVERVGRLERMERVRAAREGAPAGDGVAAEARSQSSDGFRNRLRDRVRRIDRSGDSTTVISPTAGPGPRIVTPETRDGRAEGNWREVRTRRDGDRRFDGRRYDNSWRDSWRRDNRYDWRSHRNRHRSLFSFGIYYDPFGYSYRPYSIGWPIRSSYWGDRYWLSDPWMYRLPTVYGHYRWVRYWDDALLVDTWSGRVVDVIHNFFW